MKDPIDNVISVIKEANRYAIEVCGYGRIPYEGYRNAFEFRQIVHSWTDRKFIIRITGPQFVSHSEHANTQILKLIPQIEACGFKRFGKIQEYLCDSWRYGGEYRSAVQFKPLNNR